MLNKQINKKEANNLLIYTTEWAIERFERIVNKEFDHCSDEDDLFQSSINCEVLKKMNLQYSPHDASLHTCPCCYLSRLFRYMDNKRKVSFDMYKYFSSYFNSSSCFCILKVAIRNNIVPGDYCLQSFHNRKYPKVVKDIKNL